MKNYFKNHNFRSKVLVTLCFLFAGILNMSISSKNVDSADYSLADITFSASAFTNESTCYSTYVTNMFGGGSITIWVCGSCVQQNVKSHSDPGVCEFE